MVSLFRHKISRARCSSGCVLFQPSSWKVQGDRGIVKFSSDCVHEVPPGFVVRGPLPTHLGYPWTQPGSCYPPFRIRKDLLRWFSDSILRSTGTSHCAVWNSRSCVSPLFDKFLCLLNRSSFLPGHFLSLVWLCLSHLSSRWLWSGAGVPRILHPPSSCRHFIPPGVRPDEDFSSWLAHVMPWGSF